MHLVDAVLLMLKIVAGRVGDCGCHVALMSLGWHRPPGGHLLGNRVLCRLLPAVHQGNMLDTGNRSTRCGPFILWVVGCMYK